MMMTNLEKMRQALDKFCLENYDNSEEFSGRNFTLYAVDGGGYDIDGDVVFCLQDDSFYLVIYDRHNDLTSRFNFKIVEEED
jgi:hypothetical protein